MKEDREQLRIALDKKTLLIINSIIDRMRLEGYQCTLSDAVNIGIQGLDGVQIESLAYIYGNYNNK